MSTAARPFRRLERPRSFAVLAGLALALLVTPIPAAQAVGIGACTITGKIRFTPSPGASDRGMWDISPAVIQCHGVFNFMSSPRHRRGFGEWFSGTPQRFTGSGSYTSLTSADGECLHELGEGTVAYLITTENQDLHVVEKNTFRLAGAGTFSTPQLHGTFQIPLHDSQCLSGPATTALFVAEAGWVRTSGARK